MKRPKTSTFPSSPFLTAVLLIVLFTFRLWFGLLSDIWYQMDIYTLGVKYYSGAGWPYFGPSVADHIQLPGALQAALVAWPWYIWPAPEATIILLALLSFGALCLLAWYISKRLPAIPRWLLWGWLFTAPWTLDWSTQLDNDSYILFGGILFFVGFLETIPAFTLKLIKPGLANFMMGFAFFWCLQLHMSFVLLVPFFLASFFFQWKTGKIPGLAKAFLFSFLGSLLPLALLVPTFLHYGLSQGIGRADHSVTLNCSNAATLFTILARYLSLASCEISRCAGANTAERLDFLKAYPWAAPFSIAAFLLGIVQVLLLLAGWFQKVKLPKGFKKLKLWLEKEHPKKDWPAVKWLALLTFLLIYASFLFSIKPPASHTFYVTLPVVIIYSFYVYLPFTANRLFQRVAMVLLACNLIFHITLALSFLHTRSIYKNRDLLVRSIVEKNYHLVGERRSDTIY